MMVLKPGVFKKVVTAAGTREQLTTSNLTALAVLIQAEDDNTGIMYVGDNLVSSALGVELSAGDNITFSAVELGLASAEISLEDIWLDSSINGDGIIAIFMKVK